MADRVCRDRAAYAQFFSRAVSHVVLCFCLSSSAAHNAGMARLGANAANRYEIAHTIIMGWDVGPPKAVKNWEETPVWNFEQEETARLHEAVGRNGKSPRDKSEALLDEETNQMAKQLYPANAEVASDQIRYKGQQREHHAPAKYGKEELKYLWRKHPRMRNDDLRLHPYYTRSSGQQHDAVQSENDVPDWQLITGQSVNTGGFLSLMSTDEQEEVAQRFSLRPPPSQLQQWPSPSHNALPGEANSEFAPHARSPAILDGALLASQPNATKSMHATIAEIAGATRDAMEIDPPRRMSASSADVGRMTMSGIGGQESETSSAGEGKGRLREDATLSGDFGSELFAAKPLVGETPVIDEARARDARAQLEEWVDRNSAIWQGKQKHPLEKETEAQPKVARDTNTQREDSGAQLSEKAKGKQRAVWVTPTDDSPAQDSNGDARQTGKSHKDSTAAHTDGTTSKPDVGEFERDEFIAFGAKLNQLRVCIICLGRSHLKTRFVLDQAWNMARYDEDAEKILVSMLTELRVGVRIERYGSAKEERYLKQTVDLQPFAANREMKDVGKGKRKAQ